MKSKFIFSSTLLIAGLLLAFQSYSQESPKKATIKIITNENGKVTEIEKEVEVKGEGELEEILEKYGIYNEIEISEPGEDVEVIIRKSRKNDDLKNLDKEIRIEVEKALEGLDEDIKVMMFNTMESSEPKAFLGVYGKMNIQKEIMENEIGEIITKESSLEDDKVDGVIITGIVEGSAAEKAGINEDDVIKTIDGTKVQDFDELAKIIRSKSPGESIQIELITKEGEEKNIDVTLGERQPEIRTFHTPNRHKVIVHEENFTKKPFLGITLDEETAQGIKIGNAIENSTAKAIGMQQGDVLQKINGTSIKTFDELKNELAKLEVGDDIKVEYLRGEEALSGTAKIKSRLETKGMPEGFKFEFDSDNIKGFNYAFSGDENKEIIIKEVRVNIAMSEVSKSDAKDLKKATGLDVSNNNLGFNEFVIAPNPTRGNLKLNFTPQESGQLELLLVDQSGKQIYNEQFNAEKTNYNKEIDFQEQPNGVYFLIMKQGDNTYTKKIIKQ